MTLLQFSHSGVSDSLLPYGLKHARQPPLSSAVSQSFLRFVFIELVMRSNHLILCWHLLLLPFIFPSINILTASYIFPITLKIKTKNQTKKAATAF